MELTRRELLHAAAAVAAARMPEERPPLYGDGHAAERIVARLAEQFDDGGQDGLFTGPAPGGPPAAHSVHMPDPSDAARSQSR